MKFTLLPNGSTRWRPIYFPNHPKLDAAAEVVWWVMMAILIYQWIFD